MQLRFIDHCDEQRNWGGCEETVGKLVPGQVYEAERLEEHSWHTKVFLMGVASGRGFNTASFEYPPAKGTPP
jgi:hypothetical protein